MNKEEFDKLIDNELIIILDTNVILDLARYSIYTSKLILDKFEAYNNLMWLPNQVIDEYTKNKNRVFSKYDKKYSDVLDNLVNINKKNINNFKKNISNFKKYEYSFLPNLEKDIIDKSDEIEKLINEYKVKEFSEPKDEDSSFTSRIEDFVSSVIKNREYDTRLSANEFIKAIEEGELRYKYNIPPGYLDKDKSIDKKNNKAITYGDLTRKFGDYFLWKEILKLPSESKCGSIIFITDDTKGDWGYFDKEGNFKIDKFLLKEFSEINPYTSINFLTIKDFFDIFYTDLSVDKRPKIELNLKDDNFIWRVQDKLNGDIEEYMLNQDVYSIPPVIADYRENNGELYSTISGYEISYIYFEDKNVDIGYDVFFNFDLSFDSFLYSGKDDDTGEIIYNEGTNHNFTLFIRSEIKRSFDYYDVDNFEDEDYEIINVEIIDFVENSCIDYGYDENYY